MGDERTRLIEKIKYFNYEYEWIIENITSMCRSGGIITSNAFTDKLDISRMEWCLELWPNSKDAEGDMILCLNLELYDYTRTWKPYVPTKFKLGIVNPKGEKLCFIESEKQFRENAAWGKVKFITRDILLDEKFKLISDDTLTIFCEISAMPGNEDVTPPIPPLFELDDFQLALQNNGSSDVTIVVDGKEFPTHKNILAAHSIVFEAMFQCNMRESQTNRVEIDDIDGNIMEEFINYIYTGKINNLYEIVINLLVVADKYDMNDLRNTCEKTLSESFTFNNVLEIFDISDKFRLPKLREEVKKFIVTYSEVIGRTLEFEWMVRTNPHLAVELFQSLSNSIILDYIVFQY